MTAPTHVSTNLQEVLERAREEAKKARMGTQGVPRPRVHKKRKGRPTRLHPALQERIVARILGGSFQETAAVAEGVPKSTFHSWKAKAVEALAVYDATGEMPEGQQVFVDFLEAIEEARAQVESRASEAIQRLAFGGEVVEVEEHFDPDDPDMVTGRTIRFAKADGPSLRWFLSKGFAHHWGDRVEISGPDGAGIPIEVEVSARDLLRDQMNQVAERLGVKDEDEEAGDE